MALLHDAVLAPSKADLVGAWLPSRLWAPNAQIRSGVSYRLDDPGGEVGIEGFLLTDTDGRTTHVLLTYRGTPLHDAEEHLLGTMEHSVLGTRWVYDGCHDPVAVTALASTIATGGSQADELIDAGGTVERRDPQVRVRGSGEPGATLRPLGTLSVLDAEATTTISCDFGELVVVRRIGADPHCPHTLAATWSEGTGRALAGLRRV